MVQIRSQMLPPPGSGSFYDDDRSGEGIFIQTLDAGRVLVSWYTYGPDGGQAWLIGEGVISGDRVTVENLQQVTNGYFVRSSILMRSSARAGVSW